MNYPRLVINKMLYAIELSIASIYLALNDSPTPAVEAELMESLSDLKATKASLVEHRNLIDAQSVTFPPPDPALLQAIAALTQEVQAATLDGAAAQLRMAAGLKALVFAQSIMSMR